MTDGPAPTESPADAPGERMHILGIETSCDETAAAVVSNGTRILSSVVASQIDLHHPYGGVVPELASRKHVQAIVPVVQKALQAAHLSLNEIEGVSATQGPGLIGSLVVGFNYAKALAHARQLPWIGVDHLLGHLYSIFLGPTQPVFPYVALLVSGGHTALYKVTTVTQARLLGRTRDDAAGEAYDKVAKMLGLGYPGGQVIDELAIQGNSRAIRFPRAYIDRNSLDFSFSGLKTAVLRYLQIHPESQRAAVADIAAAFQAAVVEVLAHKLFLAAQITGCRHLAVVGGVAANSGLRQALRKMGGDKGLTVHVPDRSLCGDNAAMVAGLGYHFLSAGDRGDLDADVYSRAN